jgi:RNase P subunit RPR2
MIQARKAATSASDAEATSAPCPKCATTMILAAITRHPIVAHMERHTFLCAKCNQTKTYMLQAKFRHEAVPIAPTELT